MAREWRSLLADSLFQAIIQASQLLEKPIERIEVIGSTIHVDAGGRRLVFRTTLNQTYDRPGGTPMLGGTSCGAELVSDREGIPVTRLSRFLEIFKTSPKR
jgi:hypothetical protein